MLTVSLLTSLGFMLIGFDNGLMGGLVNAPAFQNTFNNPSANMIGTIVAIFESQLMEVSGFDDTNPAPSWLLPRCYDHGLCW